LNLFRTDRPKTLTRLFLDYFETAQHERKIFFSKNENGSYSGNGMGDLVTSVFDLCERFAEFGLRKNDKVAIISENRFEWVICDFACMFYGVISVPVYPSLAPVQISHILKESESKICFVSGTSLLEKVSSLRSNLPDLKKMIIFNQTDNTELKDHTSYFGDMVRQGIPRKYELIIKPLAAMSEAVSEDDVLTIIYTSGTTGVPKGVMLTHKNLWTNIKACTNVLSISETDTFLSFLPYSHSYERVAGYYLAFFSRARIFYAQSIETLSAQMPEVKPTMLITVPRLLDRIYNRLLKSAEDMESGIKKNLFVSAIDMAREQRVKKYSLKWRFADKLVYSKIRAKTGGEIRFLVSGGGALNVRIGKFFEYIGLTTLEGYGLTETSPVISVNPPAKNKFGTVGPPLKGVNVKLSEENEILVSGELVMKGYYKDEKSTNEMIINGWLYTGDIGEIDNDGYIKITDRIKSLFKTSGGKYIAPAPLEDLISTMPFVESVMVCGNGRMYVTALIVPQRNDLLIYAAKNNFTFNTYEDLFTNERLIEQIQKDIDLLQKDISQYEKVRRVALLKEPFTIEGGELTPTLKVKRKFVEEKYADEIEKMYLNI
jgi:long-chain acyl-CoA synthetase